MLLLGGAPRIYGQELRLHSPAKPQGVNQFAEIIKCERSRVDLGHLLGLDSFSIERSLEMDPTLMEFAEDEESDAAYLAVGDSGSGGHGGGGHGHGACVAAEPASGHGALAGGHGGGHGAATAAKSRIHDLSQVGSIGIRMEGELENCKFNYFMGNLLKEKSADLYRSKGVLSIHDQGDTKFVFQGVHESINFGPAQEPWKEGEPRINKMVWIGKGLDREALTEVR
jgi:G3E family GTPase